MTSQHHAEQPDNPKIVHMAHDIGFFLGTAYTRLADITHKEHHEAQQAAQTDEQKEQGSVQAEREQHQTTKKAEEMVDKFSERLSSLAQTARTNLQKTAARIREDAEDIWAEAHIIHQAQHQHLRI